MDSWFAIAQADQRLGRPELRQNTVSPKSGDIGYHEPNSDARNSDAGNSDSRNLRFQAHSLSDKRVQIAN
ncbi:hypothetical protein SAMN06265222_102175 [Neorhodopirellula lusitana]|uniref:Uncharacterized protein n=1 Tax=Neorhodopirellula lusitana TaxID=445327 RepID=A0ABY1PTB9_9BACT|nr:hypothetical protein SAMN06265222_102175 [Neorhodopirellula lusitana]